MQKEKGILVFDIGKTHKKCFLFSESFQLLFEEIISIDQIPDSDLFPSEDLMAILSWMEKMLLTLKKKFHLTAVNFSAYGASFVLIDPQGKPILPIYNYLKPIDSTLENTFYTTFPDLEFLSASPRSGFLNSGFQLYWLKYTQPEKFNLLQFALHLPQFFHYHFTRNFVSECCSIGCHTSLWDYTLENYHPWVKKETIDPVLAPIVSAKHRSNGIGLLENIAVGVGIHDSSAALIPYLKAEKEPFVLLSTGTWNVSLNPFSNAPLTKEELEKGCLNYMTTSKTPIKACRFFMGGAHDQLCLHLSEYYNVPATFYKSIDYEESTYEQTTPFLAKHWSLSTTDFLFDTPLFFENYGSLMEAYYAVMKSLIQIQLESLRLVLGEQKIKSLYIDGGFQNNTLFVKQMAKSFPELTVYRSDFSLGAALGAALCVHPIPFEKKDLFDIYGMERL